MISNFPEYLYKLFTAPVRIGIYPIVSLYEGETKLKEFRWNDKIISFTIDRVGENSKFFGFGVSHRLNLHLIDTNRELDITTSNSLKLWFTTNIALNWLPTFYVSEVHRNENTNELSITAYDTLHSNGKRKVEELAVVMPYNIGEFAVACADALGVSGVTLLGDVETAFNTEFKYTDGANFEGTESIREALDDIAEATQTIYYIDRNNTLTFKRLDMYGDPVATITKEDYITLESSENRRLAIITHTTELGDSTTSTMGTSGSTQFVRDNAFWELRTDIANLLDDALDAVGGLTINQFTCDWRANPLLEIGDKIAFVTKDNKTIISYLLDEVITYNGGLSSKMQWSYTKDEAETANNPTTLGEALKQTFAKVDKANKQIDLVVSEVAANSESISKLTLDTESINASVQSVEQSLADAADGINADIERLTETVNAKVTATEVSLEIKKELENGVSKVATGKGFTFDDSGLTIEDINPDSNNAIKTTVSNNGMTVYSNSDEVLTANDKGVTAKDLHARTYLIIGENSRLEDLNNRTVCFWIGG
jgi:hypothetical protein